MAIKLVCEKCGKKVSGTENIKPEGWKCVECRIEEMSVMEEFKMNSEISFEDEEIAIKQANELFDEELMVMDVYAEQEINYWRDAL